MIYDNRYYFLAHAPEHHLHKSGTYIITCGTYKKQYVLNSPAKLTLVRNLLFELAEKYHWRLQAWAVVSNHYHFVANSPVDASTLRNILSTLHTLSAKELNRIEGKPKRRVWHNYFDSRITYEKSLLARLKYVHHNPVHHGLVHDAELYEWCSAAWFARELSNAFVKTVNSFKIDQVRLYDEFDLKALSSPRTPNKDTRPPASSKINVECGGPKGCDSNSTPLSNISAMRPVSRLPS